MTKRGRDVRLRTIDLFCGGGGSSWGAKAAGAEIVRGIDAWDLAARTYESNFGEGRGVTLRMEENTRPAVLGDIGPIDLILASPECTHHTCARGNRPRDEGSRLTANYIINFAEDLKPRWMVLENVIHMRGWQGYEALLGKLRGLGYHVRDQILDAADFGVPQGRRRLFLLCDNVHLPLPVRPIAGGPRTVKEHILLDPTGTWRSRPLVTDKRASGTLERAGRAIQALGRGVPFLIVYYGSDGSGGWQPLDRPIRTLTTLDRFGLVTWQGDTPMLRMLQVPELRRAMGFDDGYVLPHGSRRDRIRLLGNGVCPPVMEAIIRSMTTTNCAFMAAE
ncbi:DNA cytosine methyltransferase [Pararhodospirillum oryzae]|uniref:DNA (cytosine-5-)-methyltransferase n=1 Tax=Pararhodospirillum oryzae TaxID=478448 RepID=A0A512HB07_9PROT|nr:DNA cytosine methyltransferase [Pararhodospirillum oryzae]GEO82618.1 DNA methyltransferase [Pararhodospirillum oryzae]